MKQNPGMTGLHQRHSLNVKEVLSKLVWEAADLKFFNQLFQEGLEQGVGMNKSRSWFCLYKHFHCAGFETKELVSAGPWAIPSCQMLNTASESAAVEKEQQWPQRDQGVMSRCVSSKGFCTISSPKTDVAETPHRFSLTLTAVPWGPSLIFKASTPSAN